MNEEEKLKREDAWYHPHPHPHLCSCIMYHVCARRKKKKRKGKKEEGVCGYEEGKGRKKDGIFSILSKHTHKS